MRAAAAPDGSVTTIANAAVCGVGMCWWRCYDDAAQHRRQQQVAMNQGAAHTAAAGGGQPCISSGRLVGGQAWRPASWGIRHGQSTPPPCIGCRSQSQRQLLPQVTEMHPRVMAQPTTDPVPGPLPPLLSPTFTPTPALSTPLSDSLAVQHSITHAHPVRVVQQGTPAMSKRANMPK